MKMGLESNHKRTTMIHSKPNYPTLQIQIMKKGISVRFIEYLHVILVKLTVY